MCRAGLIILLSLGYVRNLTFYVEKIFFNNCIEFILGSHLFRLIILVPMTKNDNLKFRQWQYNEAIDWYD